MSLDVGSMLRVFLEGILSLFAATLLKCWGMTFEVEVSDDISQLVLGLEYVSFSILPRSDFPIFSGAQLPTSHI